MNLKLNNLRIAAIVPIRQNSERVPGKNFRLLAGKPLYYHIIESLIACQHVDEVWIDTDSDTLMEEAPEMFPVRMIPRPDYLKGDMIPMNDILLYDVDRIEADIYIQTHCTNPLLSHGTISHAIEAFTKSEAHDSLFTVTRLQERLYDSAGSPINHNPDMLLRTQDLEPVYIENSNMYIFTRQVIKQRKNRIGYTPLMFEMSALEAIDIDEENDFLMVEALFEMRSREDA